MESNIEDKNNSGASDLFELIQSIQSKLNDEQKLDTNNTKFEEASKEVNNLKSENTNMNNMNNNNNLDFSGLSSILGKINIPELLSGLGNSNNNSNKKSQNNYSNENINSSNSDNLNIDMNTIFKMQKIIGSMNKSDPRKNLLLSLKPFLRQSRQDKINEYITILSLTSVLGIFGDKGSD